MGEWNLPAANDKIAELERKLNEAEMKWHNEADARIAQISALNIKIAIRDAEIRKWCACSNDSTVAHCDDCDDGDCPLNVHIRKRKQ